VPCVVVVEIAIYWAGFVYGKFAVGMDAISMLVVITAWRNATTSLGFVVLFVSMKDVFNKVSCVGKIMHHTKSHHDAQNVAALTVDNETMLFV